jgi:hypothetical protein
LKRKPKNDGKLPRRRRFAPTLQQRPNRVFKEPKEASAGIKRSFTLDMKKSTVAFTLLALVAFFLTAVEARSSYRRGGSGGNIYRGGSGGNNGGGRPDYSGPGGSGGNGVIGGGRPDFSGPGGSGSNNGGGNSYRPDYPGSYRPDYPSRGRFFG